MGRRHRGNFTYREIDPDELEIGQLLGEGAYGKVYKGTFRGAAVGMTSHPYYTCFQIHEFPNFFIIVITAIKTFDQIKLEDADEDMLAEIREEAQMMEILGRL